MNSEIENFRRENLEDERNFFQESSEGEDIDLTYEEEINYKISKCDNKREVNKVKTMSDMSSMSYVIYPMMLFIHDLFCQNLSQVH